MNEALKLIYDELYLSCNTIQAKDKENFFVEKKVCDAVLQKIDDARIEVAKSDILYAQLVVFRLCSDINLMWLSSTDGLAARMLAETEERIRAVLKSSVDESFKGHIAKEI